MAASLPLVYNNVLLSSLVTNALNNINHYDSTVCTTGIF